jgi:hypothetical protein
LLIAFDHLRGVWTPGTYHIEVTADGATGACAVTLPLDCPASASCTGNRAWTPSLAGCIQSPSSFAIGGVSFSESSPAEVTVRITLDDRELGMARFTPSYKTSYPNGPDCDPTCHTASASVEIRP